MREGRWFYRGEEGFLAICEKLKATACPHCKVIGLLVLRGFLRGSDESSPREKMVRARRIFCGTRNNRQGCGRTFRVWLADKIRRLVALSADSLWMFLPSVVTSGLVEAIRHVNCHLSDRPMPRIGKRFGLGQSPIRTALWQLCEPPELPELPAQLSLPYDAVEDLQFLFAESAAGECKPDL